jgi:hypothetical protein
MCSAAGFSSPEFLKPGFFTAERWPGPEFSSSKVHEPKNFRTIAGENRKNTRTFLNTPTKRVNLNTFPHDRPGRARPH